MTAAETRAHTCVHEAPAFRAEVDLPPSINNAYANVAGRGRVPTAKHRDWKMVAAWELWALGAPKLAGPYRLKILVPEKMRGDVPNRVKLAEDLLVSLGITPDDKHAVAVTAERSADVPAGRCFIIVEAA